MDDIKTKSLNEKATISSAIGSPKHEDECKPSGAASTDNGNKKTDTVDDINSAQDKQDAAADLTEASTDGEDFLLRVESSDFDSETFEDAVDGEAIASKEKIDAKSATSKKSETLFSDIESSDDSIAYESQEKSDVKSVDKKTTLAPVLEKDLPEEKKTIEPEFDPVESDEEFFEDPPLPERIGQLSQESISSKSLEGEERNSTPLIDEEVGKSEELNLDTEENTRESNPEPDESLDLLVESSVELEDTIVSESIDYSNLNNEMSTEIVTGKVLEEEESETVGDERNSPNSPNSLLLEEEKEKSSTIESDSLEKVIATSEASILPKVAPRSLSPDKNTEKKETLANDDSETTTTSSTILEDKNISSSPLPETMETDIEMTEDLILKDDEKLEVNDSIASVEEPMQIDETILEVSDASEMETNEDFIPIEKSDEILNQDELQKSIEKEIVEDQKITDEPSKENEKVSTSAENISDDEEEFNKSIEKEPTESSEIEVKESEENSVTTKLDEVVEEENKSEENLKEIESHCDLIEDLPMIDSEAIRSDDVLEASKKLTSADIKEIESTEKEILEKVDEEVTESLEKKSNDGEKTQIEASDETEKLSEITTDSLDDNKTAEQITDSNKTSLEIDEEDAETSKVTQSTVPDKTSPEVTKKILETFEQVIEKEAEPTEKIESSKEIEESAEKSDSPDSTEKIKSPKKLVETSEEENKQPSESVKDQKSSKEIVKINEEPTSEKEEAPQQVVDTSQKPITPTNKVGTVSETVDLIDLSDEETPANDTEKSPKPVEEEESKKHDKPKTIEEQALPRSKETTDSKEPEKVKVTEEVISSNIETLSEDIEIPEVTTEVLVEKVVEVAASLESSKSKEENLDANKSSSNEDPEIIEIDDDDDDPLPEEKKLEESSKKEETISSSSTSEKELSEKKNENETTKTTERKESNDDDIPMEIDEELTNHQPSQIPIEKPLEDKSSDQDTNKVEESADDSKKIDQENTSVQVLDDDEEPLLMIDTSHKEDNDNESIMDNETATSAPSTDSSSEGSLEIFYDKECVNYECKRGTKNFYRATVFALNYFKISKKRTKTQFVCEDCYDRALGSYEELCKTLKQKQPLLHGTTFKTQEFVEIIDSSDEEESDAGGDKIKDENTLPKESIEMLEAELEGAIRKVMHNVDIQKQLSWTKQILQQRLTNLQEDSDFVSDQLRALQRKADHMHNSLYQCPKIKLRQLTPLDLNSGRMYNPESDNASNMPPPGEIVRTPICVNEQYYAVKTKAIASWVPCKVIEEVEGYPSGYNPTKTYKIRFTKLAKYPMFKTVYAKHMAYYDPPSVRLPIGSRVIAYFDATSLSRGKEKMLIPSAFYPGIIAEPLKQSNKFRYLVFYDDGYFQYVNHKDVRLVCQASENVWEDVHHQSREFIHNYLTQYAVNRPMVQTQKGQSMLVDYNGKWIYARVIDVDCSLVQMLFEGQSRSEWIYRGSTRLGPVYKESNNHPQKNTLNATRRRTEPFIRYINGDDSSSSQQAQESQQAQPKASGSSEIRSVAKKSVSRVDNSNNNNNTPSNSNAAQQPVPTVRHLNNSVIFVDDDNKPKGKVVYYTARKNLPPRDYVPHICNPACPFNITHNLTFYSPLAKPLLSGWERQVFRQKSKKFIVYRGPCGKRMRNIEELHRYLRVTDNELNVDNFDFSPDTNCLAEYVLEKCLVNKKDISCGKEKMPIPCVNYYDESMPPACEYSAVRIPTEGVPLNLDEEFLCGCDCEDDCSDKTKCACWKLTYAGAKYGMPSVPTEMVGYQYKRLYEHVPTGIYECNSRCKCKANCVNRVVQQPLQSKLQVFKTSNRGWGLRCINDVPRGSFICVYAGQMLTEQVANEGGLDAGDEYFAELDYIEVAEQIKEGYESDVHEPEEEEELYNPERDDDDTDFRASLSFKDKEFNTRLRARRSNKNSTDGECESQERQVISFEPNKNMDTSTEPNEKPTIRKLFGKDESCYVMDAKVRGNLGRYFNHSCSPNLFVQNVFVDTHDLRFPWVAFFASTHIRAGTELTWNYNYEVGVVPGKVLYCQCGAPNCRQRLL